MNISKLIAEYQLCTPEQLRHLTSEVRRAIEVEASTQARAELFTRAVTIVKRRILKPELPVLEIKIWKFIISVVRT